MKLKKTIAIICTFMLAFSILVLSSCTGNVDTATITNWEVPDSYRNECTEAKGEVVPLSYTTRDYVLGTSATEVKTCNVYLPYGYTESESYNIIYLIHGTDPQTVDHKNTWFNTVGVKNVLDNMIANGDIQPLIVVTPQSYSYGLYGDDVKAQNTAMTEVKKNSNANFGSELRYDLIPAVEGKYSTYAESTSESALQASRDHRAMAGLSNGARLTYTSGMVENFDYISYFGCYSSSVDAETVISALNSDKYDGLKLNYMFNADGIYDFAHNAHKKMYNELLKDSHFTEDNTDYVEIAFGYHSARSWRVAFYNSLQRFFK